MSLAVGLIAGVVTLSMIAVLLLGAIIILGVFLVFDVRRRPGALSLQKQTSIEHTYQEFNVGIVCIYLFDCNKHVLAY